MPLSRPEVQTLGGDEGLVAGAGRRQQIADHALGRAIHRRAIDHRAASLEHHLENLGERRAVCGLAADIEGPPGAAADDGQRLAGGGNLALVHAAPRGWLSRRRPAEQGGAGKAQEGRAIQVHDHTTTLADRRRDVTLHKN